MVRPLLEIEMRICRDLVEHQQLTGPRRLSWEDEGVTQCKGEYMCCRQYQMCLWEQSAGGRIDQIVQQWMALWL